MLINNERSKQVKVKRREKPMPDLFCLRKLWGQGVSRRESICCKILDGGKKKKKSVIYRLKKIEEKNESLLIIPYPVIKINTLFSQIFEC